MCRCAWLPKGKAWSAFEYVQRNLRYINVNLFVAGMAKSRLYDSKKTQPMTRGAVSGWLSDRTLSSYSLYGDWRDWAQAGRQVAHQTGVRWPCKTVKQLNDPASTYYTEITDARINVSLTLWHVGQMFDGNQNFRPTKKKELYGRKQSWVLIGLHYWTNKCCTTVMDLPAASLDIKTLFSFFQLSFHLTECPLAILPCSYQDIGCTFKVERHVFS